MSFSRTIEALGISDDSDYYYGHVYYLDGYVCVTDDVELPPKVLIKLEPVSEESVGVRRYRVIEPGLIKRLESISLPPAFNVKTAFDTLIQKVNFNSILTEALTKGFQPEPEPGIRKDDGLDFIRSFNPQAQTQPEPQPEPQMDRLAKMAAELDSRIEAKKVEYNKLIEELITTTIPDDIQISNEWPVYVSLPMMLPRPYVEKLRLRLNQINLNCSMELDRHNPNKWELVVTRMTTK